MYVNLKKNYVVFCAIDGKTGKIKCRKYVLISSHFYTKNVYLKFMFHSINIINCSFFQIRFLFIEGGLLNLTDFTSVSKLRNKINIRNNRISSWQKCKIGIKKRHV